MYFYRLDRVLKTQMDLTMQQAQRLKQSSHKMAQLITLTLTEKQRQKKNQNTSRAATTNNVNNGAAYKNHMRACLMEAQPTETEPAHRLYVC